MKTAAVVRAYLGEGVRRAVSKLHWCTCLPREGVSAAVSKHNVFLPVFKLHSDNLFHHSLKRQFRSVDISRFAEHFLPIMLICLLAFPLNQLRPQVFQTFDSKQLEQFIDHGKPV